MIESDKAPCQFCYSISPDSVCQKCAQNLLDKVDLLQQPCRVVPDGSKFGIWYKGEIRIHSLPLATARAVAAFVNSALRERGVTFPER